MSTYYNQPTHGERTKDGQWQDARPLDATSTWDDVAASIHGPDCDVLGCDYRSLTADGGCIELTYHGGDGLWMCPTHWAEFYPYEPPRLTTYGDLKDLQGK